MKEETRETWKILVDKQIFWGIITQKTKNEEENIEVDLTEVGSTKCTEENKLGSQDCGRHLCSWYWAFGI
jgi:hypothetical protein